MSDDEATKAVNDWNSTVIEEFRSNDGVVGGQFEGAPVLLLHTKGAKSGQQRINPMMYLDYEGKRYVRRSSDASRLVSQPHRESRRHGRSGHRDLRGDREPGLAGRA